jgi:hypothetical protein
MANFDIKAAIMKKQDDRMKKSKMTLTDVNRSLIIALTALPVYGKDVRDEEILTLIINGGVQSTYLDKMREDFQRKLDAKEIKKTKDGYRNTEGFLVLQPRI